MQPTGLKLSLEFAVEVSCKEKYKIHCYAAKARPCTQLQAANWKHQLLQLWSSVSTLDVFLHSTAEFY